jgi:hypothetical protein
VALPQQLAMPFDHLHRPALERGRHLGQQRRTVSAA